MPRAKDVAACRVAVRMFVLIPGVDRMTLIAKLLSPAGHLGGVCRRYRGRPLRWGGHRAAPDCAFL
jgi:hypothetical protein